MTFGVMKFGGRSITLPTKTPIAARRLLGRGLLGTGLLGTVLLGAGLLTAACTSPPTPSESQVLPIQGRVEGLDATITDAAIEVSRIERGVAYPVVGLQTTLRPNGSFTTELVAPGRYIVALRIPDRPPSEVAVRVPPAPPVTLRLAPPLGELSLEVRPSASIASASSHSVPPRTELECVLTRAVSPGRVPDRRTLRLSGAAPAAFGGLTPGSWRLDVPAWGATTDLFLAETAQPSVFSVPLELAELGTAEVFGRVIRLDGSPVRGVAVTARPPSSSDQELPSWGRYALTDSDGEYRIHGIPAGPTMLSVENRHAVFARLPDPVEITISPSGSAYRGFVIDE